MRIEIVDEPEDQGPLLAFPPGKHYVDLRENPHVVERIASARQYTPLRNFLIAVNSPESVFTSAAVVAECASPKRASDGEVHEFSSQVNLVFAIPSLNFDRSHYADLIAGLKELLERDSGDAVRGALRISPCDFLEQNRRGFCLGIQLLARGDSAKQAELRWGLGLARVQQALLFRARTLGQQVGA